MLASTSGRAVAHTAHSAVVRDAMDYSAALCAATGETVAQAVTIPLQLGSIPNAMRTLLEHFGDGFRPGDVFLVNDPFDGASHTPDLFVAKPCFAGETLIGFSVTVAHHGDIGGRVPGSCACDSTDVFQEGLRLPWMRLYDAGERNEALFEILEIQRLLEAQARVTLLPKDSGLMAPLLASAPAGPPATPPRRPTSSA